MVHSAGILAYKLVGTNLEVMLAHPGGPFWVKKDEASWSIPKGLIRENETALDAAKREFEEETGYKIKNELLDLGKIKQSGNKDIVIFAVEMDIDTSKVKSNLFEMEWPPKSGIIREFPENDRAQWFTLETAKRKIFKGQIGFLERLIQKINYQETGTRDYQQLSLFDLYQI